MQTKEVKPRAAIIGQYSMITKLYVGKDFIAVQVVFQPSALYRLMGIQFYRLTNTHIDAEYEYLV